MPPAASDGGAFQTAGVHSLQMFAQNPHPMWIYDLETLRILAVNDAAVRHYGYTREEFLALSAGDLYDAPCEPAELRPSGGPGPAGQRAHRKRDGTVIQVELIRHSLTYEGRRAFAVLAHDVTRHLQADAAHRESEEQFRAITDAIPLPMAITRLSDSRILYANGRFLSLFGYAPEDVTRRTVMDFVGDDEARLAIRDVLMRGDPVERQLRVRRADGAFIWVTVSMRRMIYRGEPAVIGVAFDDTQRKRTEEALRESEDRFRVVNEAIPQPVVVTRVSDGLIVYVNDQFVDFAGRPRESILGTPARDYYAGEQYRAALLEGLERDGRVEGLELQARRPDGTTAWLNVSARRMTYDGSPAILASFIDVGERKRTEEALVAAEAKFRSLVEQSLVGTYIIQDGRFQYVNPRMAEIFGETPREMLATVSVLDYVDRSDRSRVQENLRRKLQGDTDVARYSFRGRRRDGAPVDVEIHGTRTEFNGRPAVIGTLVDITERKRTEEALHYRLEFEQLIAAISTQFINLPLERIDEGIMNALRTVGEFAAADRSYVFLVSPDGQRADNTHEWCAPGIPPARPGLEDLPVGKFAWLSERLLRRETVYVPRVGDLPEEARAERERFLQDGPDWSLLLVPMVSKERVIGCLGFDVLRSPRAWSKDTGALLDLVGQIIVNALERKRAEEALRYRLEFEKLVSGLSAEFINLPVEAIDGGVRRALGKIGEFVRVDRCYVFRIDADGVLMDNTHEWCAPGVASHLDRLQRLPTDFFRWSLDRLRRFETIQIPRVADLPAEAQAEREEFERESIRSCLYVPLRYGDRLVGFLGCDAVRAEMAWSEDTVALLSLVGQTLVNAFERKRAEEALRVSEEKWRTLVTNSPDIIATVNLDGVIQFINRTLPGLTPEQVIGSNAYDYVPPEFRDEARHLVTQVVQTRSSLSHELPVPRPDGVTAWFSIRLGPVMAEGRVVALMVVGTDMSERKQAEVALRDSGRRLELAHRQLQENQAQLVQSEKMAALGLLAAGVAHEINNPVGFVMSNLGTLGDYVGVFKRLLDAHEALAMAATEEARAAAHARVEEIRRKEDLPYVLRDVDALLRESQDGAHRVKEIIQALRSFARADEGERVEVNVNEGLEATLKVVWNEIKYKCTIAKRFAPVPTFPGYPGQLNQVFLNLILNAAQAIPEKGEITIETAAEAGHVVVRISDNGVGIPAENLPKLFTPFFTTKPVGKGTGLGLSISYNIIRKHRGTIEVRSEVGRGTTFSLRLPLPEAGHA